MPVFDGNSLDIRNIAINPEPVLSPEWGNLNSVGLFQGIHDAVVKNVRLSFARFDAREFSIGATGVTYTGGLAGTAVGSIIVDVDVDGLPYEGQGQAQQTWDTHIIGGNITGGLVGFAYDTIIENASGAITVQSSIGRNQLMRQIFETVDEYLEFGHFGSNGVSIAGGLVGYLGGESVIIRSGSRQEVGHGLPGGTFEVNAEVVGGVVGLVGENAQAIDIHNRGGTWTRSKYYVGGLVGINLGSINNSGLGALASVQGGQTITAQAGTVASSFVASFIRTHDDVVILQRGMMAGGVAGFNSGSIENVRTFNVSINQPNLYAVGGIVGHNKGGTIRNCIRQGGTLVSGFFTGGIVGFVDGSSTYTVTNTTITYSDGPRTTAGTWIDTVWRTYTRNDTITYSSIGLTVNLTTSWRIRYNYEDGVGVTVESADRGEDRNNPEIDQSIITYTNTTGNYIPSGTSNPAGGAINPIFTNEIVDGVFHFMHQNGAGSPRFSNPFVGNFLLQHPVIRARMRLN